MRLIRDLHDLGLIVFVFLVFFQPFVEACIKNGNAGEAQKYMSRVTPENLVKCYIKLG